MATGTNLINTIARRLRDNSNTGYSRTHVADVLSRCNYALNAQIKSKIKTITFTPTANGQTLYQLSAAPISVTDCVRVLAIRENGVRDLLEVPWGTLVHQDDRWLRRSGTRPEIFARIGKDILVIAPGPTLNSSPQPLTLQYVANPTAIVDNGNTVEFPPDELVPILLDLTESVLLLEGREMGQEEAKAIKASLTRAADALGIEAPVGATKQRMD